MPATFGQKKNRQHYVLYTIITTLLLCSIFLSMVGFLYSDAMNEAEENLHVQTKQIKDDITLQLISDRENLSTMANFAATLYSEEERYDIMFESFKPIGLIENIGILNRDNTFVTRAGTIEVGGVFSFEEEVKKGSYLSSRVSDVTTRGKEIVRSAVPIKVGDETVGILYGVIQLDKIGAKYEKMAKELDAQLFVYDKESGDLIIDNVHDSLGNISFLKDRKYNNGSSYEEFSKNDKGFISLKSAYRDENAYMHYSTIEEIDWMIALLRYDSQVYAEVNSLIRVLFGVFVAMFVVIMVYISVLMTGEKQVNEVTACASDIRKVLLETAGDKNNVTEALEQVCFFAKARSAIFFNTDGEDYRYIVQGAALDEEGKQYIRAELLKYVSELHSMKGKVLNILSIKPNKHLCKTNPAFYKFLKENGIFDISLSGTVNSANHTTILAVFNAKRAKQVRFLAEKISACFSMALYNKNYLHRTKLIAITDSLTGAFNRVAYKNDLNVLEQEEHTNVACVYVDVNELHLINNKYGHAVGDKMLIYVANTLKDVFYGQSVYRMGGDEFLVFCKNTTPDAVKENIDLLNKELSLQKYHVATGLSFRTQNIYVEEMVREAEVRMYESKAEYYQKAKESIDKPSDNEYIQAKTGILEIDTMLSVLKENYNGIYRVSLDKDEARRILMPSYLGYNENEEHFSSLFSKYVSDWVQPDYHRSVMSFLNYEAIAHQLAENKTPKITFKKNNGESVALSVYKLGDSDVVTNTLWVFAKD